MTMTWATLMMAAVLVTAAPARAQVATAPAPSIKEPYVMVNGRTIDLADSAAVRTAFEQADRRLRDWPQIDRYRTDNAWVSPPASGEARVVFLGDSITDLWDDPKFGAFFPGKRYVNRGISAQTTPQMVLRMRADVLALRPRVLVVLAGTNDIAGNTGPMTLEQIQDNFTTIAELATLHGVRLVLASVLPVSNYHYDGRDPLGPQTLRRPIEKIRALNAWLERYAREHGHVYLDYFAASVDERGLLRAELSEDDLHPNAAGYRLMAPLAEAAIARALATPARAVAGPKSEK